MAPNSRARLLIPHREEWDIYRDPRREDQVVFCPTDQPPATGARLAVEVVFSGGPRFVMRGKVVWRRPTSDRRVRSGVGVEVEPQYRRTLSFINQWSSGQVPERREHPRLPIRLRVTYGVRGQRRINFTRDLSAGGVYIHSVQLLAEHEPIEIGLAPPSGSAPVPLTGYVARLEESDTGQGMAIRLDFPDPGSKIRFAGFVDELTRQMEQGNLAEQFLSLG